VSEGPATLLRFDFANNNGESPEEDAMTTRACLAAGLVVAVIGIGSNGASALVEPMFSAADGALHGHSTAHKADPAPRGPFALCPVGRPNHFGDDFGDARYAGGFHRHEGIDIFAPRGTRIFAPFDGKAKASYSWAGGWQVYVYRADGAFVFNAHLNGRGHTSKVRVGDVVGRVGNSGDARGASTHDHFEWHPHGGRAVDGFRLLNAVCR
jgi:murein DD-endopeptidase MepM/ murein hydrolase activator NlpD